MNPSEPPVSHVCHADCSAGRRFRDRQGHIWCQACAAAAKGAATPRAPSPARAPPPSPAPPCPACAAAMPEAALLCTACGYDTRTGRRAGIEVIPAPIESFAPTDAAERASFAFTPTMLVVGLTAVMGGIAAVAILVPLAWIALLGLGVLLLCAGFLWAIAEAIGEEDTVPAVLMLLGFIVPILSLYSLHYIFAECDNAFVKATVVLGFLGSIAGLAGILTI